MLSDETVRILHVLAADGAFRTVALSHCRGTVIYRSKMHAGLKRNFQLMSGAAWLELLCRHIPDRYEHLVRLTWGGARIARGASAHRKCNGRMRVIALIEDPEIIYRILDHLGWWAPIASARSPPLGPANWPRYATLPLTLSPVMHIPELLCRPLPVPRFGEHASRLD